jgi:hypothetical protein
MSLAVQEPKCPKCGTEMLHKKGRCNTIKFQCVNEDCPIIGLKGSFKKKRGKRNNYVLVSATVVFDSTYRGDMLKR